MKTTWESTVEVQFTWRVHVTVVFFMGVSWVGSHRHWMTPLFWAKQEPLTIINPLYKYMKKYQIGILKMIEIPIHPNDRICHGFFLHFGMIPMTNSRAKRALRVRPPPSGATAPSSRRRRRSGLRRCRSRGPWWAAGPIGFGKSTGNPIGNPMDEVPIFVDSADWDFSWEIRQSPLGKCFL